MSKFRPSGRLSGLFATGEKSGGSNGGLMKFWLTPAKAVAVTALPNHFSANPSVDGGISPPCRCVTQELSGCCGLPYSFTPSGGIIAVARAGSMRAFTPMNVRSIAHGQSAASGCGQKTWLFGNSFVHFTTTGVPRVARMLIEGHVAT